MRTGPCTPWATNEDLCAPCSNDSDNPALIDSCLQAASEVLWALSGRQFNGICESVVRPCARGGTSNPIPYRGVMSWGYVPYGWRCGCSTDACGCSGRSVVRLPNLPVFSIEEIILGDEDTVDHILDPSAYRVENEKDLVRIDGKSWPRCQNLSAEVGEPNTFQVSYTWMSQPPAIGVRAAADLACELIRSCDPNTAGTCVLPDRVSSLIRQGVTVQMADPALLLTQGLVNIRSVDLFLKAVNPNKLSQNAIVWSPDTATQAVVTQPVEAS